MTHTCHNDRNGLRRVTRVAKLVTPKSDDHLDLLGHTDKLVSKCHEPRRLAVGVTLVQLEISALDIPECLHPSPEWTLAPILPVRSIAGSCSESSPIRARSGFWAVDGNGHAGYQARENGRNTRTKLIRSPRRRGREALAG